MDDTGEPEGLGEKKSWRRKPPRLSELDSDIIDSAGDPPGVLGDDSKSSEGLYEKARLGVPKVDDE